MHAAVALSVLLLASVGHGGPRSEAPDRGTDDRLLAAVEADAYRPTAGARRWAYWGVPPAFRAAVEATVHGSRLQLSASGDATLLGAGYAGDRWSFQLTYRVRGGTGADATLSFTPSHSDEAYHAVAGLRIHVGRGADGSPRPTRLAVGTIEPFTTAAFERDTRHVLTVTRLGRRRATVALDGREIWRGDPGWAIGGLYPKLSVAGNGSSHAIDVVPRVRVGFRYPGDPPSAVAAVREAFVRDALAARSDTGSFSPFNDIDGWTATALIFEWRRSGDRAVEQALDRWATWRAGTAPELGTFPGDPGPGSMLHNLGEPGIPLAIWAQERDRPDWARVITDMVEQAGWTGCGADVTEWCRIGNLQPDGSVAHVGDAAAQYALNHFQVAETAAFIAAHQVGSPVLLGQRRDWLRSLPGRVYPTNPCTIVEALGPDRGTTDQRPWWMRSRKYAPMMLFQLGLAYDRYPSDPIWSEPAVRELLACGLGTMRSQVLGPVGWTTDNERVNYAMGMQELGAARLLEPLLGRRLGGRVADQRIRVQWARLADGQTLRVRGTEPEPSGLPGYWTAVMILMLDAADVDEIP